MEWFFTYHFPTSEIRELLAASSAPCYAKHSITSIVMEILAGQTNALNHILSEARLLWQSTLAGGPPSLFVSLKLFYTRILVYEIWSRRQRPTFRMSLPFSSTNNAIQVLSGVGDIGVDNGTLRASLYYRMPRYANERAR